MDLSNQYPQWPLHGAYCAIHEALGNDQQPPHQVKQQPR
jgi:hypothetical protein